MQLKVTRSGSRTYLQIVQAYRDPATGKPRQRHVASLGRLDSMRPADFDALISGLARVAGTAPPAQATAPTPPTSPLHLRAVALLLHHLAPDTLAAAPHDLTSVVARVAALLAPATTAGPPNGPSQAPLAPLPAPLLRSVATEIQRRALSACHDTNFILIELLAPDLVEAAADPRAAVPSNSTAHGDSVLVVARDGSGAPLAHDVLPTPSIGLPFARHLLAAFCRRLPRGGQLVAAAPAFADPVSFCHNMTAAAGRHVEPLAITPARLHPDLRQRALAASSRLLCGRGTVVPYDGLRLLLLRSHALQHKARRARASNIVASLRLARLLTTCLDAQDAPGASTERQVLTDVDAQRLLAQQLEGSGLAQCIMAGLEDGRFFTWRWRPEALQEDLALDGVVALLTGSADVDDDEIGGHFSRWLADAMLFDRASHFSDVVAEVGDLFFVTLAVAGVLTSRLRLAGSEDAAEAALCALAGIGPGGMCEQAERPRALLESLGLGEAGAAE